MVELERKLNYTLRMRPLLKKNALYSDETEMFRTPMEAEPGDTVTIRFRTAKNNVDEVYLCHARTKCRMELEESREGFDYYSVKVVVGTTRFSYVFEVHLGSTVCCYNKLGVSRELNMNYPFRILPGFSTPEWAKGAVMYQIFPDRFRNGDTANDVMSDEYSYIGDHVKQVDNWYKTPDNMDVRNFYGGDLQGIIDKVGYLEKLGIEAIYLNPIFVSASNHKYDTQDYDYVDPHLGKIVVEDEGLLAEGDQDNSNAAKYRSRVTDQRNLDASNQLFIKLVEEAHKRGIKIILDGVFNHCGSFNKWMDRERIYEGRAGFKPGAYVSEHSPYHNYFSFREDGKWPYNEEYDGWWGHNTLPKLNYEGSTELQEDIFRIARKWVSPPYNVDGWRLDVAADLGHSSGFNHDFWRRFRKVVKEANPNALILAEHYGDADAWLQGDEWDTVMNYDAFMEPVSWFFTGMEKHSDSYREDLLGNADSFQDAMRYHMASFSMPSLLVSMNQLDNHDHSRFLTRTNHVQGRVQRWGPEKAEENVDVAVLREAVVVQMTWPGAPTLYYGDEAGVCGFTDPDNRRTYPWGKEDHELIRFYETIIRVHKEYKVLSNGSVIILYKDKDVLVYARFNAEEQVIVFVNNKNQQYDLTVEIWPAGLNRYENRSELEQVFETSKDGFSTERKSFTANGGRLYMKLRPESAVVLHHRSK
ncbi:MAG: glycoside hydrolase family 13 protein [Eubacterium sp.]|nr:glycoside hydrolase family 13 protein [Eubacterium sp.]